MTKYGAAYATDSSSPLASTTQIMGDASPLSTTCHKLTGQNFFLGHNLSSCTFVDVARKITSRAVQHDLTHVNFKNWKAENNLVMSWLINSMTPEIGENFLLYSIKDIWDVARETYSC